MNLQESLNLLSRKSRVSVAILMLTGSSLGLMFSVSAGLQQTKVVSGSRALQESEETLEACQVSVKKSRVYIFVDKTGFGHQHGVEGRLKSGSLKLGAVENAGEFVFDITSFDADTDAARRYVGLQGSTDQSTRQQVNDNMKNKQILNAREYPTAKFAIKSAEMLDRKDRNGTPLYELAGEFTLRGKTRPLKIEVAAETKDGMSHVRGRFSILQTQYGITPFSKALGAIGVADKLTIHGDVWVATENSAARKQTAVKQATEKGVSP